MPLNDPNDFGELQQKMIETGHELGLGRLGGSLRVLCASGVHHPVRLSIEQRDEYERQLAERQKEKWDRWWAEGGPGSGPPPEPILRSSSSTSPSKPVEPLLPEIDQTRLGAIREQISANGAPWDSVRADETRTRLIKKLAAFDWQLTQSLAGGRKCDWDDWDTVRELLAGAGIGVEAGLSGFADCWQLPLNRRALYQRWLAARALELGQRLEAAQKNGRIRHSVLTSALLPEDYPFGALELRLFSENWLGSVAIPTSSANQALLILSSSTLLATLAAWLSDDAYIAGGIRRGTLYSRLRTDRSLSGTAPAKEIFTGFLFGCDHKTIHRFLGQTYGQNYSADALGEQLAELIYQDSLVHVENPRRGWIHFLKSLEPEFTRPLEDSDIDVDYHRNYGTGLRKGMSRFHRDEFELHIAALLNRLRFTANALIVETIQESLGSEFGIVTCADDSIAIEGDKAALETIRPELVEGVRNRLESAFSGIVVSIFAGIAQDCASALADAGKGDRLSVEEEAP
jgi:hypothetical protein